ncbi:MAG: PEP-CTERM sorting domain-containing protein [Microcoleaceae cyanobacterium]
MSQKPGTKPSLSASLIAGWLSVAGMTGLATLLPSPVQAMSIKQDVTPLANQLTKDYSVLDLYTGGYTTGTRGSQTLDDFSFLDQAQLPGLVGDAQTVSDNAFAVNATQTFNSASITAPFTIQDAGLSTQFRNLIQFSGSLDLSNTEVTLKGGRGATFVIVVEDDLKLNNSSFKLEGGALTDNVLFVVGGSADLSNNSSLFGSLFVTGDGSTTSISNGVIDGSVIAQQIALADAEINGVYFVPEPLTILGTGAALGFGAVFKKEYGKKQQKSKAKA